MPDENNSILFARCGYILLLSSFQFSNSHILQEQTGKRGFWFGDPDPPADGKIKILASFRPPLLLLLLLPIYRLLVPICINFEYVLIRLNEKQFWLEYKHGNRAVRTGSMVRRRICLETGGKPTKQKNKTEKKQRKKRGWQRIGDSE